MDADKKKKKPTWTEDRVERLRALWAEGHSASVIAKELGGVTRNAVIGKVHRLRLEGRAPARRAPKRRQPPNTVKRPPRARNGGSIAIDLDKNPEPAPVPEPKVRPVPAPLPPVEGKIKDIMELDRHTCRWPIGDPGDENFAYCGERVSAGYPYCEHHAREAYQSPSDRRRRAS